MLPVLKREETLGQIEHKEDPQTLHTHTQN